MGERSCIYRVLMGKCEGERPLRLGWEENMLNLQDVG